MFFSASVKLCLNLIAPGERPFVSPLVLERVPCPIVREEQDSCSGKFQTGLLHGPHRLFFF